MALSSISNLESRYLEQGPAETNGDSIIYVMSRDQRVADNHALIAAQKYAQKRKLPLAVVFCMYPSSGMRAREHYTFMITGLKEVERSFKQLNIPFVLILGPPKERLMAAIHHYNPAVVFFDFNSLKGPRNIVDYVAKTRHVIVVDTHNIVPTWVASDKQEYAARTIRPKIHNLLASYIVEPEVPTHSEHSWSGPVISMDDLDSKILSILKHVKMNNTEIGFKSGEASAHAALEVFVAERLRGYAKNRNDPSKDGLSDLSPYLHFGQLSSLRVVLSVLKAVSLDASLQVDADTLIEEIVVRKELSDNYCYYNNNYDSLLGAPAWAQVTLKKHQDDTREFIYTRYQFETAQTHDNAWNAAQKQLIKTGKMHGYMRMYWAKKVLEWSESAEQAIETLIYFNDFYSIDGGDPNGYVGILWSVAGLHDRPWGERAVYGTVRSMVHAGLKRKFDIDAYIAYY